MIIKIAKGRGTMRLPLKLPATVSEFKDAFLLCTAQAAMDGFGSRAWTAL